MVRTVIRPPHERINRWTATERRVIAALTRHEPASRNLNEAVEEGASFGQRLADQVARFGGSWTLIVIFTVGLSGWIVFNLLMFRSFGASFDPYPFIFLNLVLSMVLGRIM